jgi:hypothetical protein
LPRRAYASFDCSIPPILGAEVLFLIASVATMVPVGIYVTRNQKLKNSLMFWLSLSVVIVTNAFLFLFIWILTGENYISLFLVLMVVTVVMMLLLE